MDLESVPRWAYLLGALFLAAVLASVTNAILVETFQIDEAFRVITVIAMMTPIVIYAGIWFDESRHEYWERSRQHMVGDVAFMLAAAIAGSTMVIIALVDLGLGRLVREIAAMLVGLGSAWVLFYWRNIDIYRGARE